MPTFNYQKAYCTQAAPSFNSLDKEVLEAHKELLHLVGDLKQDRSLAIPLNDDIKSVFDTLSDVQIAHLSRASYFVGHWHPSLLPRLFSSSKGESWKISNCADQILRARIKTPHNVEIHEGKFRVTFSSRDCWMWEEFGLATEQNLTIFKEWKLPFSESKLKSNADKLAKATGDLWQDVDAMPKNDLYREYLELKQAKQKQDIQKSFDDKITRLEKDKADAQKEIEFLMACNELNLPIDNLIYYSHTDTFNFGWRKSLSSEENENISGKLGGLSEKYNITFK